MPPAAHVTVGDVPARKQGSPGPYRPKGRPRYEELKDDIDTSDSSENSLPMSRSYVNQKLAQIAGRYGAAAHSKQRETTIDTTSSREALTLAPPVPLAHPYNLPPPPPPPPSTPRTTLQGFLQSELPETLRRGLLWERQTGKVNPVPLHRSTNAGEGAAGRPGYLTTMPRLVRLSAKTSKADAKETGQKECERELQAKEDEERTCMVFVGKPRRSDDCHASGW